MRGLYVAWLLVISPLSATRSDASTACSSADLSHRDCLLPPKKVDEPAQGDSALQRLLGALRLATRPRPEDADDSGETYVDHTFVGDRSGSMDSFDLAIKDGARKFLQAKKGTSGFTQFVAFDNEIEVPYAGPASLLSQADIDNCVREMSPRGGTRLYATAIEQIEAQRDRIQAWRRDHPDGRVRATFTLLTDGADMDGSRSEGQLEAAVLAHRALLAPEEGDIVCIFMGANQGRGGHRAMAVRLGFDENTCLEVSPDSRGGSAAMQAMIDMTGRVETGESTSTNSAFSGLERASSCPVDPPLERQSTFFLTRMFADRHASAPTGRVPRSMPSVPEQSDDTSCYGGCRNPCPRRARK